MSFLTYQNFTTEVKGLNDFDESKWPTNVAGLYYAYHIMVGLGTILIALMIAAVFLLWRKKIGIQVEYLEYLICLAVPLHC